MSLWPEHPWHKHPEAIKQAESAVLRLAQGPDENDTPRHYVVGLATDFGNVEFDFPEARWIHFPDVGKPTHLLVWTSSSSHVFDYHDVNHAYIGS